MENGSSQCTRCGWKTQAINISAMENKQESKKNFISSETLKNFAML
jgi:hypothetical protein